jgi:hypothetical protein
MRDGGTLGGVFASAPRRAAWLATSPAVMLALIFLLAAAYFGSSRGFGHFLFSIPTLPFLFLCALAAAIWATTKKAQRKRAAVAWAVIAATPLVYVSSYYIVQHVRFLVWAPLHYSLMAEALKKDGIVQGWDSWGMAGSDTFSYLVVDKQDRLRSKSRSEEWTKEVGQSCGLWQADRMWPKIYVVTTYTDCPYDGVEPG